MTNVTSLNLENNNIESISTLNLNQYEKINLKNQTITKNVASSITQVTYPNIFTEAKKSSSKLYSSSNFTFKGCYEKSDGTGIVLTSDTATVKINDGNASGTIMTITREADNAPTIQMYNTTTNKEINSGSAIANNTKVRLVFSDDRGISGYNITNTTTQPTTWITQYDQEPITNVRIVEKKFTTLGFNYIWVKDTSGKITKTQLMVTQGALTKGDINGDGKINIADVLKLRRYIANSTKWPLSNAEKSRADINGDGKINIADVLKLRRYIAAMSNASIKAKHPNWVW